MPNFTISTSTKNKGNNMKEVHLGKKAKLIKIGSFAFLNIKVRHNVKFYGNKP